jgi:hypothetical protein
MHPVRNVVLAALAIWLAASIGIGFFAVVISGGYVNSPLEAVPWLSRVTFVPTILASLFLATIPSRFINSTASRHFIAIVTAYFTVVLIGSVFTVIDGTLRFGGVNEWGYFVSSWIYALIFIPITYPACLLLLRIRTESEKKQIQTEQDAAANP